MGALVHRNWVLTTARCIGEENPTSYTIVAGLVNFNKTDGEQLNNISEIFRHPLYRKESDEHNLAMVKVRKYSELSLIFMIIQCGVCVKYERK